MASGSGSAFPLDGAVGSESNDTIGRPSAVAVFASLVTPAWTVSDCLGYLRILKAGNRPGDNAPMAYVELVDRQIAGPAVDAE